MKIIITSTFVFQLALFSNGQWTIVEQDSDCIYVATYFLNDSVGFVIGNCEFNGVEIKKTTNYGASWNSVFIGSDDLIYDIYFPSDSVGYCSTHENVLKTTNGGETWFYPNAEFEGYPYRSIVFQDEEIGFGCFADGGQAFATTIDGGVTWVENYEYGGRELLKLGDCEIRVISGQYGQSDNCWDSYETSYSDIGNRTKSNLAMPNKDTILVCGHGLNDGSSQNFGFIAKSTNDGEVWSIQDFLSTSALRSIISLNDSVFFCVGYPFDPNPHAFLKSINGGYSWNYQDYETTCTECFAVDVRDVFCPSENVCYAISGEGLIYRTLNGGGELYPLANSVEEHLFASFDISPNPTTDHITIKSNLNIESIQITNCFGQSVQPRIKLSSKSVTLDVSFLVSGLYYISFETEIGSAVQRFLKQ